MYRQISKYTDRQITKQIDRLKFFFFESWIDEQIYIMYESRIFFMIDKCLEIYKKYEID